MPARIVQSDILKKSRKELEITQALFRVRKDSYVPSGKRIEGSRPAQFKAMAGLVPKEINVVNTDKTFQSTVKGGANAIVEDRVKKLDCISTKGFVPRMLGNDVSNKKYSKQEKSKLVIKERVSNCKAKNNNEKRPRELLLDGKIEAIFDDHREGSAELHNESCRRMEKHKRRKVIFEDDDVGDENSFGDQNLMGINDHNRWMSKGSTQVEQQSYCCSKPIDEPTWRGNFKIGQKYVSLAGHLSTKYCEKVWKLSRSLSHIVEVSKLSRSKAWTKTSKPNDDNIGLYFFPHEMRQNDESDELLKEVIEKDLALQAIVGDAKMLIFPSTILPEQYKTFKTKHYLWGVFKPREQNDIVVSESLDAIGSCAPKVEEETQCSKTNQDEVQYKEQYKETILMKSATPLENQDLPSKNMYEVQATSVQVRSNVGLEPLDLEQGQGEHNAMCTGKAMTNAASSMGPSRRVFGFVVGQTPRLLQLIQEVEREGGVVFAMQGETIGFESRPRNIANPL